MKPNEWEQIFEEIGVKYLIGVPASELKALFNLTTVENYIASREDEAIGMACGLHLAGESPIVAIQSSGLGNIVNSLASLILPYDIRIMILISRRGGKQEKNEVQKVMGCSAVSILESMNLTVMQPADKDELKNAITSTYGERVSVVIDDTILKGAG